MFRHSSVNRTASRCSRTAALSMCTEFEQSSAILNMFPIIGFIIPPESTTLTFTFNASTRLTNYTAD